MNSPASVHPGLRGTDVNSLLPVLETASIFLSFCSITTEYSSVSAASGIHVSFAILVSPSPDSKFNSETGDGIAAATTVVSGQLTTALISAITSSFDANLISSRAGISGCASIAGCASISGCPTTSGIASVITSPFR